MMNGASKPNKKKMENLVAFLIILIVTLIVMNTILNGDKKNKNEIKESQYKELATDSKNSETMADDLEERIERILGTMSGVRKSECFSYIFKII